MEFQQTSFDEIIDVKQLTVSMKWTTAADFDLAAAYETKEGKRSLVYFGDLGNLETFPYIRLSKDDGIGDTSGDHEEILQINRLYGMNYVWLFCWDYGRVQEGKSARFKDSDVNLTITDNLGSNVTVEIDTGERGNVYYMASIDNTNPTGATLINTSLAGTLKGLKTLEQLIALVRYTNEKSTL
jgi:uncharacterized protein involved in tellurium resistance